MRFISVAQLERDLIAKISLIPTDINLVVGVPRSGMLVASLIALQRNLPLTDMESYQEGKIYQAGVTKSKKNFVSCFDSIKKVLVVEDSVCNGNSIRRVKKELETDGNEIIYFAAYVTKENKNLVDIYLDVVDFPRLFEWNYLQSNLLEWACCDIDGVLCEDPSDEENDDGENYIRFIANVPVKLLPSVKIGWLVTSRLEKYRKETEQWLDKNGIEYGELIMMEVETAEERRRRGNHASFKAEQFKKERKALWFIESNEQQAREIAHLVDKPVFCIEDHMFYESSNWNAAWTKVKYKTPKTWRGWVKVFIPKKVRRFIVDKIKKIM